MSSTLKESAKKKKKGQDLISSASKTVPTVNGKARHAGVSKQKAEERRKRDETDDDTDEESDQDSEDSESGDVDEAGMNRLMELLGDDGLDDIAKLQLEIMENEDDDDDGEGEGSEDDEDDEEDESVQEEDIQENRSGQDSDGSSDPEGSDDEKEQEIDLEDVSSIDGDVVPRQKLLINNEAALDRVRENIQLDPSLPWTETLAVTYDKGIEVDVNDDLKRELEFYKQAIHGANLARSLAAKHQLPFTRPADFYAEMVKSDAHMERIRQRLLDETAVIKKSEEKKREREGKKFGKQVQMEKLKERERAKKDMDDRIRGLKRKRKDALDGDEFEVELEDALKERPAKRQAGKTGKPGSSMSRTKRDAKFGFGGKVGRRAKQNTKESTDSFGGGSQSRKPVGGKGKKGPAKRLGKSRRMRASGK